MSVEKFNRNFEDLFNWDTSEQPTTEQEYQNAVKNWTQTEMNLVDTVLWQPETAYSVGNIAKTPSLPSQYILVCTEAGDSGVAEPDYTGVSVGDTVVDGTATWLVSTIANGGNIDALTTAVEANTQAIGEHSTAIAENTANVATNTENIATNAENIATNASDIATNATDIEVADKRISNVEKLLQGNLYDYQTDETVAYEKTVPAGAMPYAGIERIGGKTVVWNQLCNATDGTKYGMVCSLASDGTYSIEGQNSRNSWSPVITFPITNHKYLIKCADVTNYDGYGSIAVLYNTSSTVAVQNYGTRIFDNTNGTYSSISFSAYNNANVKVSGKFTAHDLTLMSGSGNEPTTVEEFQQMFPAEYHPYNSGELLSAGVSEVVSKKADTTTLATYSIPAEIQALEGYGWSAGSVYNYIDFERKVFVKCVDKIVLDGTQTLSLKNWRPLTNTVAWAYPSSLVNCKRPSIDSYKANIISAELPTTDYGSIYSNDAPGIAISKSATAYSFFVRVANTSLTTESAINTYLSANPITVYYPLSTPIETDISAYLTDDNLISVEAGGTLTFPNSNGDNYRIPVPSEETYMINLQEAVSNG